MLVLGCKPGCRGQARMFHPIQPGTLTTLLKGDPAPPKAHPVVEEAVAEEAVVEEAVVESAPESHPGPSEPPV